MEIIIKCEPKEIAALALELQERRVLEDLADDLVSHLQAAADRNEPVYQP